MAGINKVIIVGNLGSKPTINQTSKGNAVSNFSVATSESWTDRSTGFKEERTEWHRISCYGKTAENAYEYLDKGSKVYVEGKLSTSKWQDDNGHDRYTTDVVVSGHNGIIQYLDKKPVEAKQDERQFPYDSMSGFKSRKDPNDQNEKIQNDQNKDEDEDDIPF